MPLGIAVALLYTHTARSLIAAPLEHSTVHANRIDTGIMELGAIHQKIIDE